MKDHPLYNSFISALNKVNNGNIEIGFADLHAILSFDSAIALKYFRIIFSIQSKSCFRRQSIA